jgi:hypothetical protein
MRPVGYYLLALLFCILLYMPAVSDASRPIVSFQMTSGTQIQEEMLNRLLRDMQELTRENALKPEQRAEIKSLLSRTRLLRQKLQNSHSGSFPSHHQKQLQEIKLRLDAIKNSLPPRPLHIEKQPTAVAWTPVSSPVS